MVLNAKQAKTLANEKRDSETTAELDAILADIYEKANSGRYSLLIPNEITNATATKLRKMGYSVKQTNYRNEPQTEVSWD